MRKILEAEVVIIGSGAGGASLAYELAKRGKKVVILEKGAIIPKIGTEKASFAYYDRYARLKSKEGIIIYRTIMAGGTTVVSCGNGVRSLEKELKDLGIDISTELDEAEKDLGVKPFDLKFMGQGTKTILESAERLGYRFVPMPKYIDFSRCHSCGNCILGCMPRAKWTALDYLKKAQNLGTSLITNFKLDSILISDQNKAVGVSGNVFGSELIVVSDKVVLATGGLETPKILQKAGLSAGNELFCDLFNVVYGITKDVGLLKEPTMALVSHDFAKKQGFVLSPFLDTPLSFLFSHFKYLKLAFKRNRLLGIMTKIKDDALGGVDKNGIISKRISRADRDKLEKGAHIAKTILIEAGADPKSISVMVPRGAHPGGTASIGRVIDTNQETRVKNLFISDASVLPEAPGLPPILTIIALSKRLAKMLC